MKKEALQGLHPEQNKLLFFNFKCDSRPNKLLISWCAQISYFFLKVDKLLNVAKNISDLPLTSPK